MNAIYFDSRMTDEERRTRLYDGDVIVCPPCRSSVALCEFAAGMIRSAFGDLNPVEAQYALPVEEYAAILSKLKPSFIHHDESKRLIREMFAELGYDLDKTYFDVPRMRSSTSDDYLTTGIAYAWHPHRDTWYSAPFSQINWWMPIFEIDHNNGIAFHQRYWTDPVANNSQIYNYYEWNKTHRAAAVKFLKEDPRPLPRPTERVDVDSQIRPVCPVGGIILFSAAQLHSSVPNTSGKTRFSLDFRTVNLDDVAAKRGAHNVDTACTGTSLRDFLRARDLERIPSDVIDLYRDGTEESGDLLYAPSNASSSSN
jgi:hypothetical protein